jgi:AraC-like DNA-binding protein
MTLTHTLLNTVVLLGALQGFIISGLLFRLVESNKKYLALILFLLSLACLNTFFLEFEFYESSNFWQVINGVVPMVIVMPIGPLIYLYIKVSLFDDYKLSKLDKVHFYPLILDLIPSLVATGYLVSLSINLIVNQKISIWDTFINSYLMYVDIPRWFSVTLYTFAAWRLLRSPKAVLNKTHNSKGLMLTVLGFSIFQLIWLCHLIPYLIPSLSNKMLSYVSWYPIYIPLAVLVYFLSVNGYFIKRSEESTNRKPNQLSIEEKIFCITSLENAMIHEQLFLKPTLSLSEVVNHTGINQKIISAVLNQHLGKTFNSFINEYRITEVKKRLIDPKFNHLTITGIAFESGFNSQATFQRTFRQMTGQSPREYKQLNIEYL